jgi:hypothetical protein
MFAKLNTKSCNLRFHRQSCQDIVRGDEEQIVRASICWWLLLPIGIAAPESIRILKLRDSRGVTRLPMHAELVFP